MTKPIDLLPMVLPIVSVALSLAASAHVVLKKRDTRAAIGWIGLIWLSPFLGTLLYVLLGINRIRRKAHSLREDQPRSLPLPAHPCSTALFQETLGGSADHLESLARLVGETTDQPLLAGNTIELLPGGDWAYPAMREAIEQARHSIAMSSYIFNDDLAGRPMAEALGRARERGVEVCVLIDDLGARYDWPTVFRLFRRLGVRAERFLPTLAPGYVPYLNLRNHRKILVVDGAIGFTGGMNIDKDFMHRLKTRHPKNDLHFRLRGPIVGHLAQTFADDWAFATGEVLSGTTWFPALEPVGPVLARGVAAGPDQEEDTLRTTLLGAIASARESIAIMTPYFLPDSALLSALYVAALRGVRVDILMPRENNLQTVQFACAAQIGEVLEGGCRAWYSPPPFDHSKLMVVDGAWTFIGSANWDPRSLRLNFEFNVECYDLDFARAMTTYFESKLRTAAPLTLDEINGRSPMVKLRDGIARLFSPYL